MIKRTVTAFILIPLVVWLVLFLNIKYFAIFILFINLLAYMEWLNMDNRPFNGIKALYFAINTPYIFLLLFNYNMAFYMLISAFIINLVINFAQIDKNRMLLNYYYFSGILYSSLYAFMYFIIKSQNGRAILMAMLVSIWAGDSFAYIMGKQFGKHKLSQHISPKKTIEGAIFGVVFGVIFGLIAGYILKIPIQAACIIGFIANIAGIVGDLSESVIKRTFNKKDSSNLIPGHGGILDRLDSVAFSGFFVYILILWKIL